MGKVINFEEKKAEKEIAERKEKAREVALTNLKGQLWDYALPSFATKEQFGQLSDIVNGKYQELLKNTPSQEVYEQVFYPALSDKTKSVNSIYIQETSAKILQESLLSIKAEDLMQYIGSNKSVENKDYQGKYIAEIKDDKVKMQMIGSAISKVVNDKLGEVLGESNKEIINGLEKLVSKPEENKEKKAA